MATKKTANKASAKATGSAKSASAKTATPKASKKAVETVETVEATEVTPSEAPVLTAKADITATSEAVEPKAHTCSACGVGESTNEKGELNFSILANGKKRTICKPCQTTKSGEWTTAKKDYRKAYARAQFLIARGIPAVVPNAKDWTPEQVMMTVARDAEGNIYVTDVPAETVYAEQLAEAKALREANKAAQDALNAAAKAERKATRDAEKAERDAKRLADAEKAKADRLEAKAKRDAERAEKAKADKALKDAEKAEKKAQRDADNLKKAADQKAARDKKAADRAAEAVQRNLDKAAKSAEAKKAQIDANAQKSIAALTKNKVQTATV